MPDRDSDLRPEAVAPGGRRAWLAERAASLGCAAAGAAALIAMLAYQAAAGTLVSLPPLTHTVPPLAVTLLLAAAGAARREPGWRLWLAGIAAAGASVVAGWVVIGLAVVLAAWLAIWLVSELAG